jgi:CPA2 family monovalent cation:H+ antiporter-2
MLRQVARTGSRELFTLSVLAIALGIALGSAKLFGVSFALGAFFAGVVLSESDLSHKAAANSLPLQDAFAVLFFVSVGMLFNPNILAQQPLMVIGVLGLILVGKTVIALGIVLLLGYPLSTALMVSAALAQIGEFSFILAGLGIRYELLPPAALSLILAGALFSITLNALIFIAADGINTFVESRPGWRQRWELARGGLFTALQRDLDAGRARAEKKAAEHRTFTPQELVDRFPLFVGLTPEQREVLILHFVSRQAQPGERVIRTGDPADAIYFIETGEVEVKVGAQKLKLGPGDFFGEMALLTGHTRSADVTALDYSKFLKLSTRDFRYFLRRHPSLRAQITALADQREKMNLEARAKPEVDG